MNLIRVNKFKSSIVNGGLPFTPDVIEIDDTYVTIKKRKTPLSALQTVSIPLRNIVNIQILKSGFGTNILIESFSKSSILGKGFSVSKSMKIKNLLQGLSKE
jgi:hypothetical protein